MCYNLIYARACRPTETRPPSRALLRYWPRTRGRRRQRFFTRCWRARCYSSRHPAKGTLLVARPNMDRALAFHALAADDKASAAYPLIAYVDAGDEDKRTVDAAEVDAAGGAHGRG